MAALDSHGPDFKTQTSNGKRPGMAPYYPQIMLCILIVIGNDSQYWTLDRIIETDKVTQAVSINIHPFRNVFNSLKAANPVQIFLDMLETPSHALITCPDHLKRIEKELISLAQSTTLSLSNQKKMRR